jgi:16S rRNA (cytosine1402-N4)-methyltransferase
MVGVDRDSRAIEQARVKLEAVSIERVEMHLVQGSFGEIGEIMTRLELKHADRVLMDLGLSSDQLAASGRGFSFLRDERLDMRQDESQALTAGQVVNEYSAADLTRVIREYGEERRAGAIVEAIMVRRRRQPIERTGELVEIIERVAGARRGRTHPATRTFQALRMEVNDEEGQLRRCLPQVAELLSIGGRLAIITFHSVEDRIVKGSLKPFGRRGNRTDWQVVRLGRVLRPDAAEIRGNPRSRSAKLRVYQKVRVEKAVAG